MSALPKTDDEVVVAPPAYPFTVEDIRHALAAADEEENPFFTGAFEAQQQLGSANQPRVPKGSAGGGEWTKGGGGTSAAKTAPAPQKGKLSRAARAKLSHKAATPEKQQWAEKNELVVQQMLGKAAKVTSDSAQVDVITEGRVGGKKVLHGVEVKTLLDNKHSKVTMHPPSRKMKEFWEQGYTSIPIYNAKGDLVDAKKGRKSDVAYKGSVKEGKPPIVSKLPRVVHVVAIDDRGAFGNTHQFSGHRVYYRRGAGAWELKSMVRVRSASHLRRLMEAP